MTLQLVGTLCRSTLRNDITIRDTTVETSLIGGSITRGGWLWEAGWNYRFQLYLWSLSTTGTPTLTIRARVGGFELTSIVFDTSVIPLNGRGMFLDMSVICQLGGASGTIGAMGYGLVLDNSGTPTARRSSIEGSYSRDLTTEQAVDVTAQWSTASLSNYVVVRGGSVDWSN